MGEEMREIKFRAWGQFGSKMNKNEMIYDWQGTDWIEYVGFDGDNYFEIMQYTGLKDKNGKEIYEGDIIEYPFETLGATGGVIEWCKGGFTIKLLHTVSGYHQNIWTNDMYEIIGNIYENKELLQQK